METIIISKCCMGIPCRYNQNGCLKSRAKELALKHSVITICPEQDGGLPTPREGCSVINDKVVGRVTGKDFTPEYTYGAILALQTCKRNAIKKAYLLKSSPSCGKGYGITAKLLESKGIKVIPI